MCLVLIGCCLFKPISASIGLLAIAIAIFEKGDDNEENE
jgi:hypothetical protein